MRNKIESNFLWKFLEISVTKGAQFVIQIILARILFPEDFGVMTLILIFINFADVFVNTGLATSLVQKKTVENKDFSTVFLVNLILALFLSMTVYVLSTFISEYFEMDSLINPLRILSISLIFGSLVAVQKAYIQKHFQFKKLFYGSLISTIISGVVGIVLAYSGYGIWALVWQFLINRFLQMVVLSILSKWKPSIYFSWKILKEHFSYGWKILTASLINVTFLNIRSVIIGKVYDAEALGYYNRGKQFPSIIMQNVNGTIQAVLFPVFSLEQKNIGQVKKYQSEAISFGSYLIFPLMAGLAIIAHPLVLILLTEKWLFSVQFIRIFAFIYAFGVLNITNTQVIKALGRSDIFLRIEILKRVFDVIILVISIQFGILVIALGGVISMIITTLINSFVSTKLTKYTFLEQGRDMLPAIVISALFIILLTPIYLLNLSVYATLMFQVTGGLIILITISEIFKFKTYFYIKSMIINLVREKKNEKN